MDKRLPLLFLLGSAACQQQAPTAAADPEASPNAAAVIPANPSANPSVQAALPNLFAAGDTLTAPMRDLLRQVDLSALLRGAEEHGRPVFDGFFGPDHYRFGVAFTEVRRDSLHLETYHVRGKCRYRQHIRPFVGTLVARQVSDLEIRADMDGLLSGDTLVSTNVQEAAAAAARYEKAVKQARIYSLRARFTASETMAEDSGVFDGEAFLNFFVTPDKRVGYAVEPMRDNKLPARGDRFLMRGSRLNRTTGQVKQFVVSTNVFTAAPDVYRDFGIGDRGGEINPKYARLGWDDAWRNEEWWADSPKPSLGL